MLSRSNRASVSTRKSTATQGEAAKPLKRVRFNPVVDYYYYDELDTVPFELQRIDLKNETRGRLVSVCNLNVIYGL